MGLIPTRRCAPKDGDRNPTSQTHPLSELLRQDNVTKTSIPFLAHRRLHQDSLFQMIATNRSRSRTQQLHNGRSQCIAFSPYLRLSLRGMHHCAAPRNAEAAAPPGGGPVRSATESQDRESGRRKSKTLDPGQQDGYASNSQCH